MSFDCVQASCKEKGPVRNMGRGKQAQYKPWNGAVYWGSLKDVRLVLSSNYCFRLTRTALTLTVCVWSRISGLTSHSGQTKGDDPHVGYPRPPAWGLGDRPTTTLFFFLYFRYRTAGYKSVLGRSCDRPSRHRFFLDSLCLKANAKMVPKIPSSHYMLLM